MPRSPDRLPSVNPANRFKVVFDLIVLGERCVVHPRASLHAVEGPIMIGSNNIIEENVILVNKFDSKKGYRLALWSK